MSIIAALLLAQASAVPLGSGVKVWDPSMPYPPVQAPAVPLGSGVKVWDPSMPYPPVVAVIGEPKVIVGPEPVPALERWTGPNFQFRCRVFDQNGKPATLRFEVKGPRAYPNGMGRPKQTDPVLIPQDDKLKILSGFNFKRERRQITWASSSIMTTVLYNDRNEILALDFKKAFGDSDTSEVRKKSIVISLADAEERISYPARWVGFCDQTSTPQKPLSDEEVKA